MKHVKGLKSLILNIVLLLALAYIWAIGWLAGRDDHWIILIIVGDVSVLSGQLQDLKRARGLMPPTEDGHHGIHT